MTIETKEIVGANFWNIIQEAVHLGQYGWEFKDAYWDLRDFHVTLKRDPKKARELAERVLNDLPARMTDRAEILAKARAARGKNKKEGEQE